jgi:hypothetical protein
VTVADTLFGDALSDIVRQAMNEFPLEILVAVEIGEATLLLGKRH